MFNKKTTKRALLMSCMSLLLCFSMLLGTTFAWFTDRVDSGVNTITAGNLDVELYHTNNYIANPEKVEGLTDLFTVKEGEAFLWEPGAVVWENFTVSNEGSLALKYLLSLKFFGATILTENNDKTLADVLKVAVVEGGFFGTREEAKAKDFDNTVSSFTLPEGYLEADESKTYGIIIYWEPTTDDNSYNVESGMKVDFKVQLYATQYTSESDSFGSTYDEDSEYLVYNEDELNMFIALRKKIAFGKDIELSEAVNIVANDNVIINTNGFDLIVDDNINAVDGAFILDDGASLTINAGDNAIALGNANSLVSVKSGADATIVINGGNITSTVSGSSLINPNGDGEIDIVLNNVNYTGTTYALNATRYGGTQMNVEVNGGKYEALIGIILLQGSIKNATIIAHNTKNAQPAVYGAVGNVTIENCIIKTDKSHAIAVSNGGTIEVINCKIDAGTAPDADPGAYAFQVFTSGGTIIVDGATTFDGGYGCTGPAGGKAIIIINGVEVVRK